MTDQLLTINEVSEWTRIPVDTLYNMRSLGKGPKSAKLGKRIVYRRVDVQEFIDSAFAAA